MWTLYFNITVIPEEKSLVQPLTFSDAYELSDARRKITGVSTSLVMQKE